MITKPLATSTTIKFYRANPAYFYLSRYIVGLIFFTVGLLLGGVLLYRVRHQATLSITEIMWLFGYVLAGCIAILSLRAYNQSIYLLLSDDGIEYHNGGLQIRASWNDVAHITERPNPHIVLQGGLFSAGPHATYRNLFEPDRIPLHYFSYTPMSDLAQEPRRYVPHLFDEKL